MKTYDNNIQSKLSTFFKKSFKQKINLIFVFLGIKLLVRKILYLLLTFFIKSKISFFKNIIFDINKEKSKYVFYEEKEKFILFTNDEVISKECFVNDDFEFKKFIKVVEFLKKKDYKIRKLYDIGANIGVTCIPAVNRGLVNQAVAIEPEPESFKLLKLNINLNNLEKKFCFSSDSRLSKALLE